MFHDAGESPPPFFIFVKAPLVFGLRVNFAWQLVFQMLKCLQVPVNSVSFKVWQITQEVQDEPKLNTVSVKNNKKREVEEERWADWTKN